MLFGSMINSRLLIYKKPYRLKNQRQFISTRNFIKSKLLPNFEYHCFYKEKFDLYNRRITTILLMMATLR